MLIDIEFYDKREAPNIKVQTWDGGLTLTMEGVEDEPIIVDAAKPTGQTGVYWAGAALDHFIDMYSDYRVVYEWERKFPSMRQHLDYLQEWGDGYGVADNLQQIMDAFPQYWWDSRTFILALQTVLKSEQPSQDGWRWSKHGPYIGTQDSKYDYLADEPDIDSIICYSFLEIVKNEK